ncbi:hypothetical protein PMAYCL1PPCAC_04949 [Pristionchus mayeri]|uniref:F-box domain-containing protein n=1 Tax=Pristionchus mayeri TaxID=1317129 RepID=A0AAN4Z7V9_9BILA|nr:hypothetical protein PMAYCL1PPCAC_04949 [Pristionchus mayeri]
MSMDGLPPELIHIITENLTYTDQLALSQISRQFRQFKPAICDIPSFVIFMLDGRLMLCARSLDPLSADQFLSPHPNAERTLRKDAPEGTVNCTRGFTFPPSARYAPLLCAAIRYLEFRDKFPVSLEHLDTIAALLARSSVCKLKLCVDTVGLFHIHKIPSCFPFIRSVEFVLSDNAYYNILAPFMHDGFSAKLARIGVREIILSQGMCCSNVVDGRLYGVSENEYRMERKYRVLVGDNGEESDNERTSSINFIICLFEGGIDKIIVNARSIGKTPTKKEHVDPLLDRLAKLGRSLSLELNSWVDESVEPESRGRRYSWPPMQRRSKALPDGPYTSNDDVEHGRTVTVSRKRSGPRQYEQCISIVYKVPGT